MVTTMNDQDRSFARALLESGQIEAMYDFIAGFGHRYSRLASGVAVGNMFSGLTALECKEASNNVTRRPQPLPHLPGHQLARAG